MQAPPKHDSSFYAEERVERGVDGSVNRGSMVDTAE